MVCDEVAVRSGDLRTPIKDAACRAPQRCARPRVADIFNTLVSSNGSNPLEGQTTVHRHRHHLHLCLYCTRVHRVPYCAFVLNEIN